MKNKKSSWQNKVQQFENKALSFERKLKEAGYSGQGHTSGAESFYGTYFGFGGDKQLAAGLSKPVKKLKKQRDKEAIYNINSQQKINRGYPASQSVSGFPGGESNSGIRSGVRLPNNIPNIALTPEEINSIIDREPEEEYYGFDDSESKELDEAIKEQGAGAGHQGPQRGVASDGNYRDLPGFPRYNTIEKPGNFIPDIEGDLDGDGEEDDYLTDNEYVNDVLRLNGLDIKPGFEKKLFGQDPLEENNEYVFPSYNPEPDRGVERYKQGEWNEVPQGDDWLIHHVDYSGGHTAKDAAKESPGGQSYGQIGAPKDFVPEDWGQRHPKTKEEPMDPEKLKEMINTTVREVLSQFIDEAYTGIKDKTGKGPSKGGSAAFEKNRKEVLDQDKENKPQGIDDLKKNNSDE